MVEPIIVTIDDVRQAGHCVSGARLWFAQHQIPFKPGLRSGWGSDVLLATGDALALNVVAKAQERRAHG